MVMAGKQASDAVLRRFAYVRQGVVCVERELPLHVVEEQPLAQMLARRTTRFASCGSSVRRRAQSGMTARVALAKPLVNRLAPLMY